MQLGFTQRKRIYIAANPVNQRYWDYWVYGETGFKIAAAQQPSVILLYRGIRSVFCGAIFDSTCQCAKQVTLLEHRKNSKRVKLLLSLWCKLKHSVI